MMLTFLNLVVVRGILAGLIQSSINVYQERYIGDVMISVLNKKDYIENSPEIIAVVKNLPWTKVYSARYIGSAKIEGTYKERIDYTEKANEAAGTISGIDPVNEDATTHLSEKVIEGSYTQKATDNLLVYFEKAREIGLYEDRIMRKVKAMSNGVLHPHDCQATGEQLVCSPDGKLGLCHEGLGCRDFFFGEVSRDFKFSTHELICEWKKRSPLTMPQCQNCPALGICGGGCTYSAYLRHGTIWAIDEKFCGHSLTLLKWIIWDIFSRM